MTQDLFLNPDAEYIEEIDPYSHEQKMAILLEAFAGKKSLNDILSENNISEELFYMWKMKYLG